MAMQLGGWTAFPRKSGLVVALVVTALIPLNGADAARRKRVVQPVIDIPLNEVPIPEPRPERETYVEPEGGIPIPEPRPEGETYVEPEGDVPIPEPRPDKPDDKKAEPEKAPTKDGESEKLPAKDGDSEKPAADTPPPKPDLTPPPRAATMPAEELACRAKLKDLGVSFQEQPQLADKNGCSVEWPIEVSSFSSEVKVAPPGAFNCAVALRSAEFMRDTVVPKSRSILGSPVTTIRQASAYVCRPRNGTSKLSKHAFGNALDIDSFELADKRVLGVGRVTKPVEAQFMLAVRLAACGPYTTVLGPGSNADHATHFHFDLAKRRPGSTYCK